MDEELQVITDTLDKASSPNRRRLLPGAAVLLAALLAAAPAAAADTGLELSFTVAEGMLVEACGGLVNSCRIGALSGALDLLAGIERRYANPVGQAFQPILDTDAFDTCEESPDWTPAASAPGTRGFA